VFNNVMNRVIYPLSSADEATLWQRHMGTDKLSSWDFQNGRRFEPIVQLETDTGTQIVTIKVEPERPQTGNGDRVTAASRQRYGEPVADIRQQIDQRHAVTVTTAASSKKVGPTPYDMDADEFDQLA
jgi:hypothetical protein